MGAKPVAGFVRVQKAFTDYIRHQGNTPLPPGTDTRHMDVYAELFFNNVRSLISGVFPVLREILEDSRWDDLIRDYFARHKSHTPLFPQMPKEFLRYLEEERGEVETDPAFLRELAHYEWVELALSIDTREIVTTGIDAEADLLTGVPLLSELAWPLAYRFPVHQLSPQYQPKEPPEQPTYLVVYRDREDNVGFSELNPVSARLLELMGNNQEQRNGRQLLEQIAVELQHPQPDTVIQGGLQIMKKLRDLDVILGCRTGA